MSVTTRHEDYILTEEDVLLMRNSIRGQRAIKERDFDFTYLPRPPALVRAGGDPDGSRYAFYKSFAEYPELVGPTVLGLQGMVHATEALVELPSKMEYLLERATPDQKTLQQLWQFVTSEIFSVGRISLLPEVLPIDIGKVKEPTLIATYTREALRNWRTKQIWMGPSMIILSEPQTKADGRFSSLTVEQYRILELDDNNQYRQSVITVDKESEVEESSVLISRKGLKFESIPLVIINTASLGLNIDAIPLLPMANKALDVYRKKASYGRAMYNTSDPTPTATGVKSSELPDTIGGGAMWSATSKDARFGLLEVFGTGLAAQRQAIGDDLAEAYSNAGRIMDTSKNQPEAGVAIKRQQNAQKITTVSVVVNAAQGMEKTLKNIAVIMGEDPDKVKFVPNLDFAELSIEAQDLLGIMQAKNDGLPLSQKNIHELLRQSKMTNDNFKTEIGDIDNEEPLPEATLVPAKDEE